MHNALTPPIKLPRQDRDIIRCPSPNNLIPYLLRHHRPTQLMIEDYNRVISRNIARHAGIRERCRWRPEPELIVRCFARVRRKDVNVGAIDPVDGSHKEVIRGSYSGCVDVLYIGGVGGTEVEGERFVIGGEERKGI